MLLDIDDQVFELPDYQPVWLLLSLLVEGRHDWHPRLAQAVRAADAVGAVARAARLPGVAEWMEQLVVEAANPPPADPRDTVPIGTTRLADLVADLARPAVLLVENELGDGGFVRAVAAALGEHRIVDALDRVPRWLVFAHGGGKDQMPQLARQRCAEFAVLIRVAVLFDSDRCAPDDAGNGDRVHQARAAGVDHVHMWAWRTVENYVPLRVWEEHFPHRGAKVQELRAIMPAQRGYLKVKEFFGRRSVPSQLIRRDLVLTEEDFHELGDGVVEELRQLLAMIREIL